MKKLGIKTLYPLALAEGEGVGTAYEYFTKRNLLRSWLKNSVKPASILIAGLPEKYGSSLDFVLISHELNASLTVVDERPDALKKLSTAVLSPTIKELIPDSLPMCILTKDLSLIPEMDQQYDLILSSEVLQRLEMDCRNLYLDRILMMSSHVALFTPNGDNADHTEISGLSGIKLSEIDGLIRGQQTVMTHQPINKSFKTGYIDMPPFPPGITRTDDQRNKASSGQLESIAMRGLQVYASMEKYFPLNIKSSKSHIVYALIGGS